MGGVVHRRKVLTRRGYFCQYNFFFYYPVLLQSINTAYLDDIGDSVPDHSNKNEYGNKVHHTNSLVFQHI